MPRDEWKKKRPAILGYERQKQSEERLDLAGTAFLSRHEQVGKKPSKREPKKIAKRSSKQPLCVSCGSCAQRGKSRCRPCQKKVCGLPEQPAGDARYFWKGDTLVERASPGRGAGDKTTEVVAASLTPDEHEAAYAAWRHRWESPALACDNCRGWEGAQRCHDCGGVRCGACQPYHVCRPHDGESAATADVTAVGPASGPGTGEKMGEAAHVYTDGGVRGRNPSREGGSWAWVKVDAAGNRVEHASGFVTPADLGTEVVTNNVTELFAAVCALEAVPEGWAGTLWTDSCVTYWRVVRRKKPTGMAGVPPWLVERLETAKARLGSYCVRLVKGHATDVQLAAGRVGNGKAASPHNAFADLLCQEAARRGC